MAIVPVDPHHPDPAIIAHAAARLRAGELVAFPTETVYGLGANALDAQAIAKIYAAKGRPAWNPVIAHVPDVGTARALSRAWPVSAERLAQAFWPGPLTLVVPKAAHVPDAATAGLDAVGVRVPAHPVALALLRDAGVPIAAPSANRFTQVSPTSAAHVVQSLGDRVPLVLDGGPATVGIESTVVDCTGESVVILRPGMLGRESLEAALEGTGIPVVVAQPAAVAHDAAEPIAPDHAPRSPGMADRHYAPRADVWLCTPDGHTEIVQALQERAHAPPSDGPVMVMRRTMPQLGGPVNGVLDRPMPADPTGYARELYAALHEADARQASLVVIELPPPNDSAWDGVRDRLTRAAR